ncbi:UDP-2,3-diacylglucosamine diphosphatase [Sinimarinibacterium thermocellulolyticum]|uniref:UDP-2,3-diacylglucosamine hydrolase n=1 Tax=Sinimarinibacterium thermocellulolyticum TaxID=3170016 RepID=A0ABV2AC90_9GAMM
MTALLLSDLHLPAEPSPLREGFLRFLAGPARAAQQIYILGDLFEYWIGDDVGVQVYAEEVAALRALSDTGVHVAFMHGNRDFLVGADFARASGTTLLADPSVVVLGGERVLLSHGDQWCAGDLAYQRWRRFSRNRLAQSLFLGLPPALRRRIAGDLRRHSGDGKRRKPVQIMDVDPAAIVEAFRRSGCRRIIHGHTHRPATHRMRIDGLDAERIVLADWTPQRMEWLQLDDGSRRLRL